MTTGQIIINKLENFYKNLAKKDILVIFLLGISAGAPLAFLLSTLKVLLVDAGISLVTIGFFALISIPYSFKFLWAPLIDNFSINFISKKIGKRRSWLLFLQIILFVLIFFIGSISVKDNLSLITIVALSIAFVSATQDIVIDAYRIEKITDEDQGIATAFYIYGYRIGVLFTGAFALYLSAIFSWEAVTKIISFAIVVGIFATIIANKTNEKSENKDQNIKKIFQKIIFEPFVDFAKKSNWLLILLFIVSFKLCDAFAGNMTLPFLLDIGFSKGQIAAIVKTFGLFATMFGIFAGGIMIKFFNIKTALLIGCILQAVSNLGFFMQAIYGANETLLYLVIFIENFSGGIGDVILVSYLSILCNKSFAATQYAILSSIASLGRSLFSSTSGIIAENYGWEFFFILSTVIVLPSLVLWLFIKKGCLTSQSNSP
jgi:PAT family beta-lactamase induction signal transducer AmpG